jgi:hypothetical protein
MISIAVLVIVGGAAFGLFNSMQVANTTLQGQQGLSLSLRSTASQLQSDLSNAGNGYFQGVNVPSWPVGVTIQNNWITPGTSCYNSTSGTYTSTCFDAINIITADPDHFPAVNVTDSNGDVSPSSCPSPYAGSPGSATTVYAMAAPVSQAFPSGLSLAATAAKFSPGDQLLFLHSNNSGTIMTTSILQSVTAGTKSIAMVVTQPQSDGSNVLANDPLDITACDRTNTTTSCPPVTVPVTPSFFGTTFCGSSDWIVKLVPIQYYVDTTANPSDPTLYRKQNGVASVIMDQILGFKVGASIWNTIDNSTGYSVPYYNYQASNYSISSAQPEGYNFSLVRSIRVSIIARTAPSATTNPGTYHNSFDGGAYQVLGRAIVVNPRNLSMNDDQTQALQ